MLSFFRILVLVLSVVVAASQAIALDVFKACLPPLISFEGICVSPIPGCQAYKSGTECSKCVPTFNLIDGKCSTPTDTLNTQNIAQLKLKSMSVKGTAPSVQIKFIDQLNFNMVKNAVLDKYTSFANAALQPLIKNVTKSSFDTYFLFTWTNNKNRTYLFEFGVNLEGATTELISDDWDQNLQNSAFSKINTKLRQKYSLQLIESTLTRIETISKNLFKLHYYSDFGFHYMAFIQKLPFLQIKSLETLPWKYDDQETLQYIYSQHPFLAKESSWTIQKRDHQKVRQNQVKFASQSRVVLEEIPEQRQRIVFMKREENQTLSGLNTNSKLVGGFQLLKGNSDESVQSVLNHLFKEFTILKNSEVVKIEYQLVAGVIYQITFKDKSISDQYVCKVFYSLSGEINIMEIYFNSVLVHTQPLAPLRIDSYDFMADPLFQQLNQFMKSSKGLKLPDKILYVNRILKLNEVNTFYQFEIVYESNSFVLASYFIQGPREGQIELNDFIYNGDNQLDEEDQTPLINQIQYFLEGYRAWLSPLIIEYLKETKPNDYLLKLRTEYGSFYMKVVDTGLDGFEIYYYELIDENEKCLTHSFEQIQQFMLSERGFIAGLRSSYSAKIDSGSELVSFSEGIANSQIKYRFLFVNPTNYKKVQISAVLDKTDFVVQSVSDENFGLRDITDLNVYAKAVEKAVLAFPKRLKDSKPLDGMMNATHVMVYFSRQAEQKEHLYAVSFDIALQKGEMLTLIENEQAKICSKIDAKGNCLECPPNNIGLMSKCYEEIKNCRKQIGQFCLSCNIEYTLMDNVCTNDCGVLM